MEKKREVLVLVFLLTFVLLTSFVCAEKLGLDIENYYSETGEINFQVTIYDDDNKKIEGQTDFIIKNYYSDVMEEGKAVSGQWFTYKVSENVDPRPWEINVKYNDLEISERFNIGELRKIDIQLESNDLILRNIGNVAYEGYILIYIGDQDQTANVYLSRGQTKKIRLTAPDGEYRVRVSPDGNEENDIVFSQVSLTGNVIGLEKVIEGSFWSKYPVVGLFLIALILVIITILGLKGSKKFLEKKSV